jgi:outer membrane protein OmpA-like peptidoglycan-associated protein
LSYAQTNREERPFVIRHRLLLTAGLAALIAAPQGPALAQTDPGAQRLIEMLRPGMSPSGTTRGLRLPAEPPPAGSPAPAAAAPAAAAPREAAVIRQETTAPAGVPAVSLTVTFATGSSALSPQAEQTLATLGRALASPDLAPFRFRIEGHTDTVGTSDQNQDLSRRRAETVRDFLVGRFGISAARLEAVGLGETQLLVPTPDQTPEARNRRVQVLNLGG